MLLAVFGSLRWGELAALRRCDIDVRARTVRIARQLTEQRGGGLVFGPPKSEAGRRTVAIPELITPDLAAHLVTYARPGDTGLSSRALRVRSCGTAIFAAGSGGQHSRRSGFLRCISTICAIPEIQLAADAGASLRGADGPDGALDQHAPPWCICTEVTSASRLSLTR